MLNLHLYFNSCAHLFHRKDSCCYKNEVPHLLGQEQVFVLWGGNVITTSMIIGVFRVSRYLYPACDFSRYHSNSVQPFINVD